MLDEAKLLRLLLKTERKRRELMWSSEFKEKSELLRTTLGAGPLTTRLFLSVVGDVTPSRTFNRVNRFIGLCPDSHSSGEVNGTLASHCESTASSDVCWWKLPGSLYE
jgi:hypothetical protein